MKRLMFVILSSMLMVALLIPVLPAAAVVTETTESTFYQQNPGSISYQELGNNDYYGKVNGERDKYGAWIVTWTGTIPDPWPPKLPIEPRPPWEPIIRDRLNNQIGPIIKPIKPYPFPLPRPIQNKWIEIRNANGEIYTYGIDSVNTREGLWLNYTTYSGANGKVTLIQSKRGNYCMIYSNNVYIMHFSWR